MLEVGWSEILVIALILIIVVGPKDLPQMLRTFGRMANRLRGMANEFKGQFDEALREADLDDVRKGLNEVNKLNPTNTLRDAMNPIRKLGEDIKSDLKKASDVGTVAPVVDTTPAEAVSEAKPAEPVMTPIAPAIEPTVAKVAEPAPVVAATETAAPKPKPARKKQPAPETVSEAATIAEPVAAKTRKAPVKTKDAAVAAVAAEAAAIKSSSRRKPVATTSSPDSVPADVAKPKKAAPRKKTEKTGDA